MKKEYIKQHVVPKSYLNRFAEKRNGKYIIGVRFLDQDGNIKLFERSTDDVGYIKNIYDVTDKEDPKYWEHNFASEYDLLFGQNLETIISSITLAGEGYKLSDYDRTLLSRIILAQMFRVPDNIKYVTNFPYQNALSRVKQEFYTIFPQNIINKSKDIIESFQMSEQSKKESYLNFFFDKDIFNKYAGFLKQRTWIVYYNSISKSIPFVTSDNPVLVENINHPDKIGIFINGIVNPNTVLFFPISPTIAVVNYSRYGVFTPIADKLDGHIYPLNEAGYIIRRNIRIVEQAYHHSFIPKPFYNYINKMNYTN